MRAKVLMLAEKERFREDLHASQQALSSLAVAFGHSLVMKEAVLGKEIPADVLSAAFESDAVIAFGSRDALEQLGKKMACFAGQKRFDLPEGFSRLKSGEQPKGTLMWPLSRAEAQLSKAAVAACAHTRETGGRLMLVPPAEDKAAWQNAAAKAAMYAAIPSPPVLNPEEAVDERLHGLLENQVLLASAPMTNLLGSLTAFLCGAEAMVFTTYLSGTRRLYALEPAREGGGAGLFAILYASADMVRHSLRLSREGDCLKTAVDNVLASGWRTAEVELNEKTVPNEEILRLVGEQVALAGELFERLS